MEHQIIIDVEHPDRLTLEVKITPEEINPSIDHTIQERRKNANIPGFRKGKAPLSMIQKIYGEEASYDAGKKAAIDYFWSLSDQKVIYPISTPFILDLTYTKDEGVKCTFVFEIMPDLELKNYTSQDIKKLEITVSDKEVDSEIKRIKESNMTTADADVVENEDFILTADLQKLDADNNPSSDKPIENMPIFLSTPDINAELKENAIGKKVGDKFVFKADMGGNGENSFTAEVTVKNIKKVSYPDLDEEFVKKITKNKVSSEAELRENIKQDIQSYMDERGESMFESSLIEKIVNNNDFQPPHTYVHQILTRLVQKEEETGKRRGDKRFDKKEAENRLHKQAEFTAKWYIISENLAKKENITVTDDELKSEAEKESAETGIAVDKLLNYYEESHKKDILLETKVIDFLKKNNNIIVVNKVEDYNNSQEGA